MSKKIFWVLAFVIFSWIGSIVQVQYGSVNFTFEPLAMFLAGSLLGSFWGAISMGLFAISKSLFAFASGATAAGGATALDLNSALISYTYILGAYFSGMETVLKRKNTVVLIAIIFLLLTSFISWPAFLITKLAKILFFLIIGLLFASTFILYTRMSYSLPYALPMILGLISIHSASLVINLILQNFANSGITAGNVAKIFSGILILLGGDSLLLLIAARISFDILRAREGRKIINRN